MPMVYLSVALVFDHINTWTNYNDGIVILLESRVEISTLTMMSEQYRSLRNPAAAIYEKNGEPLAEPIADETQIFTSYSFMNLATAAEWETFKGVFDLPTLTTEQQAQLGFTWADVARFHW